MLWSGRTGGKREKRFQCIGVERWDNTRFTMPKISPDLEKIVYGYLQAETALKAAKRLLGRSLKTDEWWAVIHAVAKERGDDREANVIHRPS